MAETAVGNLVGSNPTPFSLVQRKLESVLLFGLVERS